LVLAKKGFEFRVRENSLVKLVYYRLDALGAAQFVE
jgi:hypothetical protein